jgi:hypothetical protein
MAHLPDLLQQLQESIVNASPDTEKHEYHTGSLYTAGAPVYKARNEHALWHEAMDALIEPANALVLAINDGLEHAGLQLGIIHRRPKRGVGPGQKDAESRAGIVQPGTPGYSALLEEKLNEFSRGRLQSLSAWAVDNGDSQWQEAGSPRSDESFLDPDVGATETPTNHQQLNLILYIHQMVSQTLLAPQDHTDNINHSFTRPAWPCLSSANSPTIWSHKASCPATDLLCHLSEPFVNGCIVSSTRPILP